MTTGSSARSGGVPATRPGVAWSVAAVALVGLITATGFLFGGVERGGTGLGWAVPGAFLVAATLHRRPGRPVELRPHLLTVAASVAVFVAIAVLAGTGPVVAGGMAAVNLGAGLLFGLAYRWCTGSATEIPRGPGDIVLIGALAVPTGLSVVALGGTPGRGIGEVAFAPVVHVASDLVLVCLVLLPWIGRAPRTRIQYPATLPVLAAATAVCLVAPYLLPRQSLSWLVLLPALWWGLTLTLRWAALAVLGQVLLLGGVQEWVWRPGTVLADRVTVEAPPDGVVEILLAISGVLTFALVSYRERSADLAAQLRVRADADRRDAALFDDVVGSMDDGVVLTDGGRVVFTNPSARRLLGIGGDGVDLPRWLERAELRVDDGDGVGGAPGEILRQVLADPPEGDFTHVTLTGGTESGGTRRLVLAVRSVVVSDRPLAFVLVADDTQHHARRQELESFAGTVAQDLGNPLATVRRRVESAAVHLSEGRLVAGRRALVEADQATDRMRAMIDDYLAYTVTRRGVLRPTTVALDSAVRDLLADHADPEIVVVPGELTHAVQADPGLVRRLLAGLVAYSARGRIEGEEVEVRVRSEDGATPGWVRLVVEGDLAVADDDDVSIFDGGAPGSADGSGILGLALCRAIVDRHGGRLTSGADADGMTRTVVTLPLADEVVRARPNSDRAPDPAPDVAADHGADLADLRSDAPARG